LILNRFSKAGFFEDVPIFVMYSSSIFDNYSGAELANHHCCHYHAATAAALIYQDGSLTGFTSPSGPDHREHITKIGPSSNKTTLLFCKPKNYLLT
jgi:hypothetical protein